MDLYDKIQQTVASIRRHTQSTPKIGIILGTGLGGLVSQLQIDTEIEYGDIPHFPISTVESHSGKLIFGRLAGSAVVVMQGRFHLYEGYTMQQITFPVRVMKFLGVEILIVSNACGGMNPVYRKGDLMIMTDHINLLGDNPLIGPNDERLGIRFPDMSEPYHRSLIEIAEEVARENQISVHKGVYVAVAGPNLETRAEYRFLRLIGADAVGMSTVPENIVANHMGMKVLGVSVVTDECFPDTLQPANVADIIAAANSAEPKLTSIMKFVVGKLEL